MTPTLLPEPCPLKATHAGSDYLVLPSLAIGISSTQRHPLQLLHAAAKPTSAITPPRRASPLCQVHLTPIPSAEVEISCGARGFCFAVEEVKLGQAATDTLECLRGCGRLLTRGTPGSGGAKDLLPDQGR